jgi:hypothetical protein
MGPLPRPAWPVATTVLDRCAEVPGLSPVLPFVRRRRVSCFHVDSSRRRPPATGRKQREQVVFGDPSGRSRAGCLVDVTSLTDALV